MPMRLAPMKFIDALARRFDDVINTTEKKKEKYDKDTQRQLLDTKNKISKIPSGLQERADRGDTINETHYEHELVNTMAIDFAIAYIHGRKLVSGLLKPYTVKSPLVQAYEEIIINPLDRLADHHDQSDNIFLPKGNKDNEGKVEINFFSRIDNREVVEMVFNELLKGLSQASQWRGDITQPMIKANEESFNNAVTICVNALKLMARFKLPAVDIWNELVPAKLNSAAVSVLAITVRGGEVQNMKEKDIRKNVNDLLMNNHELLKTIEDVLNAFQRELKQRLEKKHEWLADRQKERAAAEEAKLAESNSSSSSSSAIKAEPTSTPALSTQTKPLKIVTTSKTPDVVSSTVVKPKQTTTAAATTTTVVKPNKASAEPEVTSVTSTSLAASPSVSAPSMTTTDVTVKPKTSSMKQQLSNGMESVVIPSELTSSTSTANAASSTAVKPETIDATVKPITAAVPSSTLTMRQQLLAVPVTIPPELISSSAPVVANADVPVAPPIADPVVAVPKGPTPSLVEEKVATPVTIADASDSIPLPPPIDLPPPPAAPPIAPAISASTVSTVGNSPASSTSASALQSPRAGDRGADFAALLAKRGEEVKNGIKAKLTVPFVIPKKPVSTETGAPPSNKEVKPGAGTLAEMLAKRFAGQKKDRKGSDDGFGDDIDKTKETTATSSMRKP